MDRTLNDAASPVIPKATLSTAIATGGTKVLTFTAGDVGRFYTLRGTQVWNPRAHASASATAGDLPHAADTHYSYKITADRLRVSVRMAVAGTLYWARTSP